MANNFERVLELTVRINEQRGEVGEVEVDVYEPETGECATFPVAFSPDCHPEFDEKLGQEIYSWITIWGEQIEQTAKDRVEDVLLNATDFIGNRPESFGAVNDDVDYIRNNKAFREKFMEDVLDSHTSDELEDLGQAECAELVWKFYRKHREDA